MSHSWLAELLREVHKAKRADEAEHHCNEAIKIQKDLVADAMDETQAQYRFRAAGASLMTRGIIRKDRGLARKDQDLPREARKAFELARSGYDEAESLLTQLVASRDLSDLHDEESRVLLSRTHLNRGVLLKSQLDKSTVDQGLLENAKQAYLQAIEQLKTVLEDCRHQGRPNGSNTNWISRSTTTISPIC